MILKFEINNITPKEADDLSMEVFNFLEQNGYMVNEYWVEEEND